MNFNSELANKNSFKFNELMSVVGVKPYVLRFWESEFEQINPIMDQDGQKYYSAQDLEYVNQIKELLFVEKHSIVEAKNILAENLKKAQSLSMQEAQMQSRNMKSELEFEYNAEKPVLSQYSSLDLMKKALANDLKYAEELKINKNQNLAPVRDLSDKDIVNLVLAKKKLTGVLNKINELIQ